jgi:hypothetical protein
MVLHYYGRTSIEQSDVAAYMSEINKAADINDLPEEKSGVDAEDIEKIYQRWGISATRLSGIVPFAVVKREINNGRPVQISIRWAEREDSSHVVVVYGWAELGLAKLLRVHDPLPDEEFEGTIRYGWLQLGCGLGVWEHTWIGIHPN